MELKDKITKYGVKLFGESNEELTNIIIEILDSKNERYLKLIPYLLYIHDVDVKKLYESTKNKALFSGIVVISNKLYEERNLNKRLLEMPDPLKLELKEYLEEFALQLNNSKLSFTKLDFERERTINFDLSCLFTPKEIEIIKKTLDNVSLSKTEYETFSRKIKKKLSAIMRLQFFSQTVSSMKPTH